MALNTVRSRALPNLSINPSAKALHGINLNDPLFAHLQRHGVGAQELTAGHNTTTRKNPMSDHVAKKGSKAKNGGGLSNAVKHPGVEKAKAKRNGLSTHEQLERDSHSSNPTTKKRGVLGLTFERMAAKRKGK